MKKMVIFTMRTAGYLMLRGYQLKGVNKNNSNPNMSVYIFDDSEDLRKAISEYDGFVDRNRGCLTK